MTSSSRFQACLVASATAVVTVIAMTAPAFAAEGMWTLDKLPRAQMQERYGFNPDAAWVDKVRLASVRLAGGCSGSFVSPQGLVMTNHHCAVGCVQQLSGPGRDRVADGYLARKQEDELRCPEMELNRLDAIIDVTAKVQAATAGKQGEAFQAAEDAMRANLANECRGADTETVRCDLVALYRGGIYQLYKYHRYSDVRLVWVPESDSADFGGDPDNFNFPRYCMDVAMLRAYEGGKPVQVSHYFRFKPEGAQPGELTLVSGNPGSTQRLLTVAQLESLRNSMALYFLPELSEQRGALLQYAAIDAESRRLALRPLAGIENTIKVLDGELQALFEPALLERKRQTERALRDYVATRPELAAKVGDPWAAIAQAQRAKRELELAFNLIEEGRGFIAPQFDQARKIVRGAAERTKPDSQRLREFSEAGLPQIEQRLQARAPAYPAFDQVRLAWSLTRLRALLGADDPTVKRVLADRSPEQAAKALVTGSRLGSADERMRLWKGGAAAVDASDDSFIQLVKLLEPTARALRQRWDSEVLAVEREASQRIALARFAQTGDSSYPDATFTLRLSYGEVQGWQDQGKTVPPYTDVAGLYRRVTGAHPFALPASWLAAKPKLDPAMRYNFVTTNDIIGGNSGSPVLNRNAEVVGLAFDGNLASLGGAFYFDERVNRTVAVHSGAILEVLRTVYQGDALAAELSGTARP